MTDLYQSVLSKHLYTWGGKPGMENKSGVVARVKGKKRD